MHVRITALDFSDPHMLKPLFTRALCNEMVESIHTVPLDNVPFAASIIGRAGLCPGCKAELVERALTSGREVKELSKLANSQGYFQKMVDAARSKPPWSGE